MNIQFRRRTLRGSDSARALASAPAPERVSSMGKNDFLTPKAIGNRIKAKGLQKLRWFCQMCQVRQREREREKTDRAQFASPRASRRACPRSFVRSRFRRCD